MSGAQTAPVLEGGRTLQADARAFIVALYASAKGLGLYGVSHAAVRKAIEELQRVASRILQAQGAIEFRVASSFFFMNGVRLPVETASFTMRKFLGDALRRHQVGGIDVEAGVDPDEWLRFLTQLIGETPDDEPTADRCARFGQRLAAESVVNIRVTPEQAIDDAAAPDSEEAEEDAARESAKRAYFQSTAVTRKVFEDVRLGRAIHAVRLKRVVQSLVDQVLNDPTSLLGMTALREYDEATFTHSVNVCILSLLIGQNLRLSKPQLYHLGLGALLHDVGKMRIDQGILRKDGPLTDAEREELARHPLRGVITLSKMHGFADVPYRAMLVVYEHHMKTDLSGYPPNRRPRSPTLFSRIVAVASGFETRTSARTFHASAAPDEALKEMLDDPSGGYDPLVVKALVNVTGIYPVGTLVILDTGELAVVAGPNPDPERLHQPLIKIISDASGAWLPRPLKADLSEEDPATGQPKRTIVKMTDPERYGVQPAEYFL